MFIAVALMVLAELTGHITLALENRSHRHIGRLPTLFRTGHTDFGHAAANRRRSADERRTASRTALLRVVVGKCYAFPRDAVNVGCLIAHHATIVMADVPGADVIAPYDEDVGLLVRRPRSRSEAEYGRERKAYHR